MATVPYQSSNVAILPAATAAIGRGAIAAIFLMGGLSKIADPAGTIAYIEAAGLPFAALGFVLAVLVETVGSAALIAGYHTRIVALGMAAFSVATALFFHNQLGDHSQFLHFFKNIAIAGGLLNVAALGGGAWSLDARR